MLLNQYEIEKYVYATARRADLKVVWHDTLEVSTDGKVINLPRITQHTTLEQAEDMLGYVAHEVSHVLYSNFEKFKEVGMDPKRSFLGAIANVLEDDGIDAINSDEFFGDRMIRNESHARAAKAILEQIDRVKAENGGTLPDELRPMLALLAWDSENKGDYYSSAPLFVEGFEKHLDKEGQEQLAALRKGDYYDRLAKLRDDTSMKRTDKTYQIARDIYEQVFKMDPDKEEERCKQRAEAEGKGKGKGEPGKEGKGKGSGSKGVQGKGEKGDGAEFYEYDYRPFMEDQHDEFISGETVSKGSHVNYEGYKPSGHHSYAPTPFRDTIVVDYPAMTSNYSRISPAEAGHSSRMDFYGREVENDHTGEGFANKVRMLLQIRSKGKTQYGTKHGKLHPANTYRVIIPDAPGYNQRVFKKRIETDILDTAVFILGDVSGSMSGHKHAHQIGAFGLMNASIGNALRIPVMMAGFTEHQCRNAMFIWRKFDNIQLSKEKLTSRMMHTSNYMSENADGDAILWAYHMLKQRKEKRKVLIVTSDGSPASSRGGDIYSFTKETIQKIEKDKSVDIVAVGIMDTNVTRLYKQHHVIKKADEIEQALLSIIERKII